MTLPPPSTCGAGPEAADAAAVAAAALAAALAAAGTARIAAVEVAGRRLWVKRPERFRNRRRGWRMRLQKGDPARSFAREVAAMRFLAERGLPVPDLLAAAEDHLVLGDAGASLKLLLADPAGSTAERVAACTAAGAALAAFHAAGFAHGRPMLKDMCWQDGRVTLIDLERFRPEPAPVSRMCTDVLVMVHSAVTQLGADAPEVAALIAGHAAAAPAAVPPAVRRRAARLRLLAPLLRLAAAASGGSREWTAALPTLRRLSTPLPPHRPPAATAPPPAVVPPLAQP